jgi:predicted TPR repeat methyltransferase
MIAPYGHSSSCGSPIGGGEDWYSLGLLQLGECYEQLGRPEAAAEVYRVLLNLRPGDEFGKTAQARLNRLPRRRP